MADRTAQPESPPAAGERVGVVDLGDRSGRTLLIVDDEFTVEWQIERPGSADFEAARREPSLV